MTFLSKYIIKDIQILKVFERLIYYKLTIKIVRLHHYQLDLDNLNGN